MQIHRSPRGWRQHFRISVRTVLIALLIPAALLGWVVHLAHLQRDSVRAIQRAGGTVLYDWEFQNGARTPAGTEPWAPRWLMDHIGADYFQHVTYVALHTSKTSEDLVHIGNLRQLETLFLSGDGVSDEGLAHLKGLANLQLLD